MRTREMKAQNTASLEALFEGLTAKVASLAQDAIQAGENTPQLPAVIVKVGRRNHVLKGLSGTRLGDGTPAIVILAEPTSVKRKARRSSDPVTFQPSAVADDLKTLSRVKKILSEQLGISESEIRADTSIDELELDSLDTVEIVMSLEEEFELELQDDELEHLSTVRQIVEYVDSKLSK